MTDIHERETQEIVVVKLCQGCNKELKEKDIRKLKGHTVCPECEDAYWQSIDEHTRPKAGE